jgi:hypothetical protein
LDRLGQTLQGWSAQVLEIEPRPKEAPGGAGDHHAARLGQPLQAGREVRRLADHRLFLRGAGADQLADHDAAGGDADPGGEACIIRRCQSCHGGHKVKAGAHRPLGLVFVRLRPAEVRQHAVAHVFRDMPAPTLDHLGAAPLVGTDHLP